MSALPHDTRTVDSKGRLTLGEAFANRTVIVEQRGDEVVVRLARIIPEREAWLYENPKALDTVRRGLRAAREGRFAQPPDLRAARRLAARIPEQSE